MFTNSRAAETNPARRMSRLLNLFTNLFPVWVLLGGGLALVEPRLFTWFKGQSIV